MQRSNPWISSVARVGTGIATVLGMFVASCAVQSANDAASTRTQAIIGEAKVTAPDIKLTLSELSNELPGVIRPDLPRGWDRVPNGCNASSDLGCQAFDDLGKGCDLMADGICRAYSPSAFTDDGTQYRWTCRCETPDIYGQGPQAP